jgi:hypothetical protein
MFYTGNLQSSTLIKHDDCAQHKDALLAHMARQKVFKTDLGTILTRTDTLVDGSLDSEYTKYQPSDSEFTLFRTVHYVGSNDIANLQVNSLLHLQRLNGNNCKFVDVHDDTVKNIQCSLAHVVETELNAAVQQSEYFGLILDESTDITVKKKLAVCVRYVASGKMVTKFLSNIGIKDGKAESIVLSVQKLCAAREFVMGKLVGIGSDGASVMTGKESGVCVRLRRAFSPHSVAVHCLAHRLALAYSDAASDVRYVNDLKSNINKLYAFFSTSAVRQGKLEAMYTVLGDPSIKLKSNIDIRWLLLNNAIQAIYQTYGSITRTLLDEAIDNKNATASGMHKFLTTFKFVAFLCLLVDVLNVLTKLSKTLQTRDFLYAYVKPKIAIAIGEIKGMKLNSGTALKMFERTCTFAPTDKPEKAIWRISDAENEIELKCTAATIDQFAVLKINTCRVWWIIWNAGYLTTRLTVVF